MKKRALINPTVFWWLCFVLFWLHQFTQRILHFSSPFLDSYLDPFLCMPILLGLITMERKYVVGVGQISPPAIGHLPEGEDIKASGDISYPKTPIGTNVLPSGELPDRAEGKTFLSSVVPTEAYQLPLFDMTIIVLVLAFIFEWGFPKWSDAFYYDPFDFVAYGLGAIAFYFLGR